MGHETRATGNAGGALRRIMHSSKVFSVTSLTARIVGELMDQQMRGRSGKGIHSLVGIATP